MDTIDADDGWGFDPELERLERLSNRVIDLIEHRRLDEAESVCLELKRQFPDAMDWIERMGAVHEARGDAIQAIAMYRQCIEFIDQDPDGFDEECTAFFLDAISRLAGTPK
jgi:hypothetical protein